MSRSQSVVCAQIGAREHYAIPRALARLNRLDTLYTDAWAAASFRPFLGRRLAGRWHPEIPDRSVVAFGGTALLESARRLVAKKPQSTEEVFLDHLRIGERFARQTRAHLSERWGKAEPPAALVSYTTGALEVLEFLAERGVPTVVDQIDPARTEEAITRHEARDWPGWEALPGRIPDAYFDRLEAEWKRATMVVINSEWSRSGLIQQGVPADKLRVLPLAYEAPESPTPTRTVSPEKTEKTVLWLGQVILRKGIQYLVSAARSLQSEPLRFVVAGPLGISPEAVRSAPSNVSFLGPVTRDRAPALFQQADLFVLPTLSDGFGVTQLEAMAHGLPVIATPNCGEVVTHGVNGLIVPPKDPDALARAIQALAFDDGQRSAMSTAALETSRSFSVQVLSARLQHLLDEVTTCRNES